MQAAMAAAGKSGDGRGYMSLLQPLGTRSRFLCVFGVRFGCFGKGGKVQGMKQPMEAERKGESLGTELQWVGREVGKGGGEEDAGVS